MMKKIKLFWILLILSALVYSPTPSSATEACTLAGMEIPPNDTPTVTLRPDGHTVDISYRFPSPSGTQTLFGQFYRNTQRGFITNPLPSDVHEVATQFGSQQRAFDRNFQENSDNGSLKYALLYQLKADDGTSSQVSNTFAFSSNNPKTRDCNAIGSVDLGLDKFYSSASDMPVPNPQIISQTATQVTLKLYYDAWYSRINCNTSNNCDAQCIPSSDFTPTHLKIQRGSQTTPSYVPWNLGVLWDESQGGVRGGCVWDRSSGFNINDCCESRYVATYTVDLPPTTSDNLTIKGFSDATGYQCEENIGTKTANVSTQTGSAVGVEPPPTITSGQVRYDLGNEMHTDIQWTSARVGQAVKLYGTNCHVGNCDNRWPNQTNLGTKEVLSGDEWVFTATDDLLGQPAGTYWYGLKFWNSTSTCPALKTDQVKLLFTPPPALEASCIVSSTAVQTDQPVSWTATAAGGTGIYNYTWSGSVSKTTFNTSSTTDTASSSFPGTGTVTEVVTITSGTQTATPTCPSVTVTAPPPIPTVSGSCGTGVARATDLVSTPNLTGEFPTSGACIIDPKAAFVPFKIPSFDDLKSLYFDQK